MALHPIRTVERAASEVGKAAGDAATYVRDYDPLRKPPKITPPPPNGYYVRRKSGGK